MASVSDESEIECGELITQQTQNFSRLTVMAPLSTQTSSLRNLGNENRERKSLENHHQTVPLPYNHGSSPQLSFLPFTMSQSTSTRQRDSDGDLLSSHANITETKEDLFSTLPSEVRCIIYKTLLGDKRILRRPEEAKARDATYIKLFDNSILTTCKIVHAEALPIFYASQTFHFSAEINGVFRESTILRAHLDMVKHISIEVTLCAQSVRKLDPIVAAHADKIIKHCTKLITLTLHVIPAIKRGDERFISQSLAQDTFTGFSAIKALKTLRSSRLQSLTIVHFGDWHDLHYFRKAIASDDQWVEGARCYTWPGLRLTRWQDDAVNVKQRRYTLAWDLFGEHTHPHKCCIRVFHACAPKTEQRLKEEEQ